MASEQSVHRAFSLDSAEYPILRIPYAAWGDLATGRLDSHDLFRLRHRLVLHIGEKCPYTPVELS
jgi:hypothetical protein